MRTLLLPLLVLLASVAPAEAGSVAEVNGRIAALLGKPSVYETSIRAFQQAVANGDRQDVAAFVRFPIRVRIGGRPVTIASADGFVRRYEAIMTADIVAAIRGQKYEDLLVTRRGVRFGDGQAWLNHTCLDRRCTRFVVKVVTLDDAPGDQGAR